MNEKKDKYEAIIGFKIGGIITTDISLARAAITLGQTKDFTLILQGVAQLMAAFDLGPNWDNLAKARILFYLKNRNEPITVEQYEKEKLG